MDHKNQKITQFGAVGDLVRRFAKVGFTPRAIRHMPPDWHFSSSGVLSSSEQGLLLGAQPRKCQLGGPYSIHISITPSFGASVDFLWVNPTLPVVTCF